jgi:hypothetical protein
VNKSFVKDDDRCICQSNHLSVVSILFLPINEHRCDKLSNKILKSFNDNTALSPTVMCRNLVKIWIQADASKEVLIIKLMIELRSIIGSGAK